MRDNKKVWKRIAFMAGQSVYFITRYRMRLMINAITVTGAFTFLLFTPELMKSLGFGSVDEEEYGKFMRITIFGILLLFLVVQGIWRLLISITEVFHDI